jgi:hypothetical protein
MATKNFGLKIDHLSTVEERHMCNGTLALVAVASLTKCKIRQLENMTITISKLILE